VAGLSVKKILKVISEVRSASGGPARLCVVGDGPAVRDVSLTLSAGATDAVNGVSAGFDVLSPGDVPLDARLLGRWRLLVLVAPGLEAAQAARLVAAARAARVAVAALVPDRDAPGGAAWLAAVGVSRGDSAASLGRPGEPKPTLQGRLAVALGDDGIALAQRLPALRRPVADHLVLSAARQNPSHFSDVDVDLEAIMSEVEHIERVDTAVDQLSLREAVVLSIEFESGVAEVHSRPVIAGSNREVGTMLRSLHTADLKHYTSLVEFARKRGFRTN